MCVICVFDDHLAFNEANLLQMFLLAWTVFQGGAMEDDFKRSCVYKIVQTLLYQELIHHHLDQQDQVTFYHQTDYFLPANLHPALYITCLVLFKQSRFTPAKMPFVLHSSPCANNTFLFQDTSSQNSIKMPIFGSLRSKFSRKNSNPSSRTASFKSNNSSNMGSSNPLIAISPPTRRPGTFTTPHHNLTHH